MHSTGSKGSAFSTGSKGSAFSTGSKGSAFSTYHQSLEDFQARLPELDENIFRYSECPQILRLAWKRWEKLIAKEFKTSPENLFSRFAGAGNLEIVKWLHEKGCPWGTSTCSEAALRGDLEMLKWLHENGCPWSTLTCEFAVEGGYLEVLKYLRENGCPWKEDTCSGAALGGHLETLKWVRQNGCPWNKEVCLEAAKKYRKHHIVEWINHQV